MVAPLVIALALGAVGVGVVVAVTAGTASRYALSPDCQQSLLADLTPDQMQEWLRDSVAPHLEMASLGRGVVKMQPAAGEPIPAWVQTRVGNCHANLVTQGLSDSAASALCRIDGRTVYMAADAADAQEVATHIYQQVIPEACAVLTIKNWAASLDAPEGAAVEAEIIWPSPAAHCLHAALLVATKMEMFARTGDDTYLVRPGDLTSAAAICAAAAGSGTSMPAPKMGLQGVSVGRSEPPDLAHIAELANAGLLHPAHVLSGAVFG